MDLVYVEDAVWYAPDLGDNRDRPEAEQFAVLLKPLSASEMKRKRDSGAAISAKKIRKGSSINFDSKYAESRARILTACILEVRNCTFVHVINGQPQRKTVTTGGELVQYAAHRDDLLEDIYAALQDQSELLESVLGKSISPFDSISMETTALGSGVAPNADAETKTISAP